MPHSRSIADAKSHFSDCIASAEAGQPVVITRHGKPVAAIVRAGDLAKLDRLGDDSPQSGLAGILGKWPDEDAFSEALDDIVARRSAPRPVRPLALPG